MSLQDIKKISIRSYLSRRGITPKIEKSGYGMYISPFREECTPSFKVDWNANLWHDFGTGEGGSIIDLVARMENCSVGEAVRRLEDNVTLPTVARGVVSDNPRIEIRSINPLNHPALVDYLHDRGIGLPMARNYCNEIRYAISDREYFAIGFKNDAGGWELRNRNFKGSSTPKNITTIRNDSDMVMVFEGFIDFLSYLSLKGNPLPTIDTTVLNSVANLQKAIPFLETHRMVHAFLDNDEAGRKTLDSLRESLPGSEVVDQSAFYRNHKDLNDYWRERCAQKIEPGFPKKRIQIPVKKKNGGPKL